MEIIGVSFLNELFPHFPQSRPSKQLSHYVSRLSQLIKGLSAVGLMAGGRGEGCVFPDILNERSNGGFPPGFEPTAAG